MWDFVPLLMPSRAFLDRVGEKVGGRVDQFGVKVINAILPGGHWTTRHNSIEHELAALHCASTPDCLQSASHMASLGTSSLSRQFTDCRGSSFRFSDQTLG